MSVNNQNLNLRKFNMSSIPDDSVVVFIGKRNTGKSFLCKDLLYYHQDIPVGTVISGTEATNSFYSKIVPGIFIHEEYNETIVERFRNRQASVVAKKNEEIQQSGGSRIDPRGFLILDDCLYDASWTKSVNVRSLFMNGRHSKVLFIITMQYPLGIPPNLRTNIDYVFILRENVVANRKRIYDCYAGMFPSFEVFCQVMDQCTENYECLVIHNNAKSNKIEDQVFWYKAESHDDFKMGADVFWRYHNENYTDKGGEVYDPTQGRKIKQVVNVNKNV